LGVFIFLLQAGSAATSGNRDHYTGEKYLATRTAAFLLAAVTGRNLGVWDPIPEHDTALVC